MQENARCKSTEGDREAERSLLAARAQTPQTETNPISGPPHDDDDGRQKGIRLQEADARAKTSSSYVDDVSLLRKIDDDNLARISGPDDDDEDDIEKGIRLQETDAWCKRRAWLQEHVPEQVAERMEALGAASKEWVSHTVVECGRARSKSVRPLPIERDFVEAMVLLQGNPFLDEMFRDNSVFPPGRVYAMGPHAIQLGSTGDGGEVVLFNDKWATPEEAPTLRVCKIDMHESGGYCLFPSFRDFLRSLVTVPLEGPVRGCHTWVKTQGDHDDLPDGDLPDGSLMVTFPEGRYLCIPYPEGTLGMPNLAEAYYSFGPAKDGTLWDLDFEADDDEADVHDAKLAQLRAGKRQLFDFLTKVWGVGPMSADEAKRWDKQAQSDSLEKLDKETADGPHS